MSLDHKKLSRLAFWFSLGVVLILLGLIVAIIGWPWQPMEYETPYTAPKEERPVLPVEDGKG